MRLSFLTAMCWLLALSQTRAGHIEILARMECEWFKPNGAKWTNVTYHYVIRITATNWHLVEMQKAERAESYGDASSIYQVFYGDLAKTNTPAAATVLPGCYPMRANYRTTVPWLAWCSHLFLESSAESPVPLPSFRASSERQAHVCDSRIVRSREAPRLPEHIDFVVAQHRLNTAVTNAMLDREGVSEIEKLSRLSRMDSEYPPGIQLAKFAGISWTNVGSLRIPREFEFLDYRIDYGARRAAFTNVQATPQSPGSAFTYVAGRYRGIAESVAYSETHLSLPPLQKVAAVADFRQRDGKRKIDHVRYFIKDGKWRQEVTPRIESAFKRRQAESDRLDSRTLAIRIATYVFMVGVALTPFAIWWKQRNKHRKCAPVEEKGK